jgi:hypothetical protein
MGTSTSDPGWADRTPLMPVTVMEGAVIALSTVGPPT